MFNGWFGAAAPTTTTPDAPANGVVTQSDSDGEFVVVDDDVGYSTSTRGGGHSTIRNPSTRDPSGDLGVGESTTTTQDVPPQEGAADCCSADKNQPPTPEATPEAPTQPPPGAPP